MNLHDLDEDYEDLYKEGWRPDPEEPTRTLPVGQCRRMCPLDEMAERERCRRLHKYEILADSDPPQVDNRLAIKEYKRSCVGRESACSHQLRPWSVLKKTLDHLLTDICSKNDDWMVVCDFVFDRLKSVRQDMVIQRIEGSRYVQVLEGSIRFLIYSMYRLICTLGDYRKVGSCKPVLSLEGPVSGLNNYEMHVVREIKLTVQCLRDCITSLLVQYETYVPDSPNRALFEAINLIVNLPFLHGHNVNSTSFQSSQSHSGDKMFKTVFRMYCHHLVGNHLSALKHLPKLKNYPLLILAYAPAIAQIQVHMIILLKKLYATSGSNTCTLKHLCSIICPEWLDENEMERLKFGKMIAVQFSLYDSNKNLCDFKVDKSNKIILPKDFVEKAAIDRKKQQVAEETERHNETRVFALQMIAGHNWSLYKKAIKRFGVESVLRVPEASIEN